MGDIVKRVALVTLAIFVLTAALLGILGILDYYPRDQVGYALVRIAGVLIIASVGITAAAVLNGSAPEPKPTGKGGKKR